jgi:hypothetical protein
MNQFCDIRRCILLERDYSRPEFLLSRAFFQLVAYREKRAKLKVTEGSSALNLD